MHASQPICHNSQYRNCCSLPSTYGYTYHHCLYRLHSCVCTMASVLCLSCAVVELVFEHFLVWLCRLQSSAFPQAWTFMDSAHNILRCLNNGPPYFELHEAMAWADKQADALRVDHKPWDSATPDKPSRDKSIGKSMKGLLTTHYTPCYESVKVRLLEETATVYGISCIHPCTCDWGLKRCASSGQFHCILWPCYGMRSCHCLCRTHTCACFLSSHLLCAVTTVRACTRQRNPYSINCTTFCCVYRCHMPPCRCCVKSYVTAAVTISCAREHAAGWRCLWPLL